MSEDKRKNARTQGRFSNEKVEFRRERDKPRNQKNASSESSSGNTDKRKGPTCVSRKVPEGVDVKYEENSNYQFKNQEKVKPEELKFSGLKELSKTENGISRLLYDPKFMEQEESEEFMTILENSTKWYGKNIVIRGKEFPQPRMVAWYGPFPYSYSGATLEAAEMPSAVLQIKEKVEAALRKYNIDVELNSVLLNLYRTGKDSVSWHSDDELTMGVCPTIASVSLGEVRKFEMRPKPHVEQYDTDTVLYVNLAPGSLIIMDGCMQLDWLHQVPKEYHDKGRRINLTFRTVFPIDKLPSQVPSFGKGRVSANPDPKSASQPKAPTEHIFDNENFPPLNAASTTKHKISNQDNVLADTSEDATEVTASTYTFDQYEYENNLNETLNQSLVDIPPPSYQESNNFNVNEPHKLPDELVGNGHSMDNYDLPRACSLYRTDLDPEVKLSDEGVEILDFPKQCIIEHPFSQLNADAPDFVPQNISQTTIYSPGTLYESYNIHKLVEEYPNVRPEDIVYFKCAIFNKIEDLRQKEFFSRRDWHELDVLQKISDDTQSEKNLRIIMERLCSMVENAAYQREREARSPHRYQNQRPYGEYSGGYRPRHRNAYKPNTYRH